MLKKFFLSILLVAFVLALILVIMLILGVNPFTENLHWDAMNFSVALVGSIIIPAVVYVAQLNIVKEHKKTQQAHREHIEQLKELQKHLIGKESKGEETAS